jgi:hypothetical protein
VTGYKFDEYHGGADMDLGQYSGGVQAYINCAQNEKEHYRGKREGDNGNGGLQATGTYLAFSIATMNLRAGSVLAAGD